MPVEGLSEELEKLQDVLAQYLVSGDVSHSSPFVREARLYLMREDGDSLKG